MISDATEFDFQHPDPNSRKNRFRSIAYDPEAQRLKKILIDINLLETSKGQTLLKRAMLATARGRQEARIEILERFEKYKVERMESGDPYMPYATPEQIASNSQGVHVCDQVRNNIPMRPDIDAFQGNLLTLGRPKSGKSSCVFNMMLQVIFLPFLILDVKNVWRYRAQALRAKVIQPPFHIDLKPPRGIGWYDWIFSIADGITQICGLQYGTVPFIEAAKIALQQRDQYINHAGHQTSLSLKDIFHALDYINIAGLKRDYVLSCKAALQLLIGPNDLFAAREGIPLEEIFNGRYIIECCHLSMMQCKFLAFYLLNYLLLASYQCLEKIHLSRIVFIDDCSAFINRPDNVFGAAPRTGFWGHVLSKLRGSGTGLVFADQLIESIYDDVKQLCNNWIVIGPMTPNNEMINAMNLTPEQANYVVKMKPRECITYFPNLYYRPIHGIVPEVPSIAEGEFNE